jgi:DNA-binding response OmpR family regulator
MPHDALTGRRILLVEAEAIVSMVLEDMLTELGCEVVGPASDLEQALEMLEADSFDAVVLDLNLNGLPSYPVADALAQRGVPFLFSTGYDNLKNGYRNLPTLQKPYGQEQLGAKLNALLSRAPHAQ